MSGMLWGLDGVILGVALGMAPFSGTSTVYAPLAVAALHDTFATVWMLVFDGSTGRLGGLWRAVTSRRGLVVCLAAVFGGPVAMSGYLFGIKYAGAEYTMALSATFPAVGALLARIFLRERITRAGWLGISLTIAGAIVVTYVPPRGDAPDFYLGIGLALLATFGWGIEGVLAIHSMAEIDSSIAGTIRMVTSCAIYLIVLMPLTGSLNLVVDAISARSIWVIIAAAAAGAGAYLTYYAANHLLGASKAMPLNAMYALWAILFGAVLTGFHPTRHLVVGVLLTIAGAVFVVTGAFRPPRRNDQGGRAEAAAIPPALDH
jgi:drug/metabolite transporter (DMT)-like permease